MVRYKYTPTALAEAAAAANSITQVMRLLAIRISGGSHAHISRQLKRFGIDTSHFTGQAHNRERIGRRTSSCELLVKLPKEARRTPGSRLKRALATIGIPEECEECGIGAVWRGRALTLHVDHINGDFLDNRPPNLRLLCPNCHSQTATYAGRNKGGGGTSQLQPDECEGQAPGSDFLGPASPPPSQAEVTALVRRVDTGGLTAVEAARRIGCNRDQVRVLQRRLAQTGTIAVARRTHDRPVRWQHEDAVIRLALAQPEFGSRKIARGITESSLGSCAISHRTVQLILREAGLATVAARRSRLTRSAGVA